MSKGGLSPIPLVEDGKPKVQKYQMPPNGIYNKAAKKAKFNKIIILILIILVHISFFSTEKKNIKIEAQYINITYVSNDFVFVDNNDVNIKGILDVSEKVNMSIYRKRVGHFDFDGKPAGVFVHNFDNAPSTLYYHYDTYVSFTFMRAWKHGQSYYAYLDIITKIHGGPVIKTFDYAVTTGNGIKEYGHQLLDHISALAMFPISILNKSVILTREPSKSWAYETALALGVENPMIFPFEETNEWVFCKNLYYGTSENFFYFNVGVNTGRKFSKAIKIAAGCIDIPATRFILENRKPNWRRHINNFDEVAEAVKAKYPSKPWEVNVQVLGTMKEQARFWNSVLFMLTVSGSNIVNIIFMRDRSVVVYFRDPLYSDIADNTVAAMQGVWILSVPFKGWENKHFEYVPDVKCNVSLAVDFVGHGLYVLENQAWPNTTVIPYYVELDLLEAYQTK